MALLIVCTLVLACMSGCTSKYADNLNKIFETEYFRCISYDNQHVTILALTELGQKQTDFLIIPKEINGMEVESLGGYIKGNSGYGIINRERYRFYPRAKKIYFEASFFLDTVQCDSTSILFLLNDDGSFLERYSLPCYICAINNHGYARYIEPNILFYKNLQENDLYWIDYADEGIKAMCPPDPIEDDYLFLGWYRDKQGLKQYEEEKFLFVQEQKIMIYAKWLEA